MDERGAGDIQAVSRASQILSLFSLERARLTVAEAAAELGLQRTTVHRYFSSLVASHLLERDPRSGEFAPGTLLVQLGALALGQRNVLELAPRYMARAVSSAHVTVVLSLWGATGAVVSRVHEDPRQPVLVTVRVGYQLPLDAAQSVLFCAFLGDQLLIERLLSGLPANSAAELRAGIDNGRRTGLAVYTAPGQGVVSVAAPVFDEYGIAATLALVGTSQSLSSATDSAEVVALAEAAADLSKEMGGDAWLPRQ